MRRIAAAIVSTGALALMSGSAHALCGPDLGTVGGPTGAVLGGSAVAAQNGTLDGTVRAAASPEDACIYVIEQALPPAIVTGPVVVVEPLAETAILHPKQDTYVFANVDGERVLVDPKTGAVVDVTN